MIQADLDRVRVDDYDIRQGKIRKELPMGGWIEARVIGNRPDMTIYIPPVGGGEEEKDELEFGKEFLLVVIGDTLEDSIFVIWNIKKNVPYVLKDESGDPIELPCEYNEQVQSFIDSTEVVGSPTYTPNNLLDASSPWGDELDSADLYRDYSSDCTLRWELSGPWPQQESVGESDEYTATNAVVPFEESWGWTRVMEREYTKGANVCYSASQEGEGETSMTYTMEALAARADLTQFAGWGDFVPGTTREWGFLGSAKLNNSLYFATIINRDENYADRHDYEHIEWDCVAYWYPSWVYGCAWYRYGGFIGGGDGTMTVSLKTPFGTEVLYNWPMYEPDCENYTENLYWHYDECYGYTIPEDTTTIKGYKQTGGIMIERETLVAPVYIGEVSSAGNIPSLPKYGVAFRVPLNLDGVVGDINPGRAATGQIFYPGQWVMGDDVGWNIYGSNPLPAVSFPRSSQILGRKDLTSEDSQISVYIYGGISYLEVTDHGKENFEMGRYVRRYYQDAFCHAKAVPYKGSRTSTERNVPLETLIKQAIIKYFDARNTYRNHPAYQEGGSQEAHDGTYDQTFTVEAPLRIGGDVMIQIRRSSLEIEI